MSTKVNTKKSVNYGIFINSPVGHTQP